MLRFTFIERKRYVGSFLPIGTPAYLYLNNNNKQSSAINVCEVGLAAPACECGKWPPSPVDRERRLIEDSEL